MVWSLKIMAITMSVICLIIQWALPVLMPLSDFLMKSVGPAVNWIVVVTLVIPAVLLTCLVIPHLTPKTAALFCTGIALDQVIGEIVYQLDLPVYLDTIGSVLVGLMMGPTAGAACAATSCCLWIVVAPVGIPFAAANIVTGWIAGLAAALDGFSNRFTVLASGLTAGISSALVAWPLIYSLRTSPVERQDFDIYSPISAVDLYFQVPFDPMELLADPIDKVAVFLMVYLLSPWILKRWDLRPYAEQIRHA